MVLENKRLKIIIVGGGLSGLGAAISCRIAGHDIEVLESASEIAEIGAGLQITPNGSRLLKDWGLSDKFWNAVSEPKSLSVHRYSGQLLAHEDNYDENIRKKYGAPFVDAHRADLQKALLYRATELGVRFHLGQKVDTIDFDFTCVKTISGASYQGDLIIAADGLWSRCRECLLNANDRPVATGDLAYRILLSLDDLKDEELRQWVKTPMVHFWVGPHAHVVGYSMRAGKMYNLVLLCPDNLPLGVSKQAGSVEEMRQLFVGWDPILNKLLSQVKKVEKWRLMHHDEMASWVNDKSNLVFIGDSCHPMLPYLAQGANSSLEDAAVLGELLQRITSKEQLPQTLRQYEKLRKARGEAIVRETFKQRRDFHLPDGPEQKDRDALFLSKLGRDLGSDTFPSRWTCPQVQPWIYGYDAYAAVREMKGCPEPPTL